MNTVNLIGRLTRDRARSMPDGDRAVCDLRIARSTTARTIRPRRCRDVRQAGRGLRRVPLEGPSGRRLRPPDLPRVGQGRRAALEALRDPGASSSCPSRRARPRRTARSQEPRRRSSAADDDIAFWVDAGQVASTRRGPRGPRRRRAKSRSRSRVGSFPAGAWCVRRSSAIRSGEARTGAGSPARDLAGQRP